MMKAFKISVGLAISALGLWFVLRDINFQQLALAFRQAGKIWMFVPIPIYMLGFIGRSWRWKLLLAHIKNIGVKAIFPVLMSGFFLNIVLPLRAGEVGRAYLAKSRFGFSVSSCLGTIVAERFLDIMVLFVITLLVMCANPFSAYKVLPQRAIIFTGLILMVLVFAAIGAVTKKSVQEFMAKLLPVWIAQRLKAFVEGMTKLTSIGSVVTMVSFSLAIWLAEGSTISILSRAFGINLSLLQGYGLMIGLCLGVSLPAAPGNIGTYEFFGVSTLAAMGVGKLEALSFVVCLHVLQVLCITSFGLPSLLLHKSSVFIKNEVDV